MLTFSEIVKLLHDVFVILHDYLRENTSLCILQMQQLNFSRPDFGINGFNNSPKSHWSMFTFFF